MTALGWVLFAVALGVAYILGILTVGLFGRRETGEAPGDRQCIGRTCEYCGGSGIVGWECGKKEDDWSMRRCLACEGTGRRKES